MSLPDLIEIVPLTKPVQAQITVPGSKSITNRALILAALAKGETILQGALWSEDTQFMVEALHNLGFKLKVTPDPDEFCNRTITVQGLDGKIPNAGTEAEPLEIYVGNAGTAARFLSALVCLGQGVYKLYGVPRMHQRPQAALFKALRELGYRIDSANDKLPATIFGKESVWRRAIQPLSPKYQDSLTMSSPKSCTISIEESSQFASALLLCADAGGWQVKVVGENAEESAYVAMTTKLIEAMPEQGVFEIEPDASSGSYFAAAKYFIPALKMFEYSEQFGTEVETEYLNPVTISHWPSSSWQVDERFPLVLLMNSALGMGLRFEQSNSPPLTASELEEMRKICKAEPISRVRDLGDSIMTAIILAPFALDSIRFTDLGRLRHQECERVVALRTELTKCGAKVIEEGDTLTVFPSKLHGAEIETYHDHRMAMCFAILGLKVPGIKIKNPACVKKTFPNFFQKLAAAPPAGLGATILDAHTQRPLTGAELFAD
ncbi:MAG: 3-phosphoshikimate 1-carboxyvinyltransferase [Pedosphaera sp.]|nr:3-phosphoshikimate 1-carboxyvinyltransferase [Pedosphaera sp.]